MYLLYRHLPIFIFLDPAASDIYTLSLHDALPIWRRAARRSPVPAEAGGRGIGLGPRRAARRGAARASDLRSEEHTSELQSLRHLVCRLLLEKKKSTGGK